MVFFFKSYFWCVKFLMILLVLLCLVNVEDMDAQQISSMKPSTIRGKGIKTGDTTKVPAKSAPKLKIGWIKAAVAKSYKSSLPVSGSVDEDKQTKKDIVASNIFSEEAVFSEEAEKISLINITPIDFYIENNMKPPLDNSSLGGKANKNKKIITTKFIPKKTKILQTIFRPQRSVRTQKLKNKQFFNFSVGFNSNFYGLMYEKVPLDSMLKISFGNVSASYLVPISIGWGMFLKQNKFSVGANLEYYISTSYLYNQTQRYYGKYAGKDWVYAYGSRPDVNLLGLGFNGAWYFKSLVVAGREVFKFYVSPTLKAYYMSYSDVLKTISSEVRGPNLPREDSDQTYSQSVLRKFPGMFFLGSDLKLGVTTRVNYRLLIDLKLGASYVLPLQKKNTVSRVVANGDENSQSPLPWAKSPQSIDLVPSLLLGGSIGLIYMFGQ